MPQTARILLLGAGHAHLLALPPLRRALPDARIVLVDCDSHATYSGMFPGHVAGHYPLDMLRVELEPFARRHEAQFLRARVCGIDAATRQVWLEGAGQDGPLTYDLASLDIGSHSALPEGLPGAADHAVALKPLGSSLARLAVQAGDPAGRTAAVVGGGVAGVEIALALAHRGFAGVSLIEAGACIVPALGRRVRRRLDQALRHAAVGLHLGRRVVEATAAGVRLDTGDWIASDLTLAATGARPQGWLARDLPTDPAGFVRVGPSLLVEGCSTLFAAGDCAAMTHAPRPKAGVFAVRQAPVLARNLVSCVQQRPVQHYLPQRDYLKIISLGRKDAVAEWHGLTLHGRWLWRWKDRIDRRFMAQFDL